MCLPPTMCKIIFYIIAIYNEGIKLGDFGCKLKDKKGNICLGRGIISYPGWEHSR